MSDNIHILTHSSLPMTKIWKADGKIEPYSKGKYFSLETIELSCINSASDFFTSMESKQKSCIIRGKYVGDEDAKQVEPECNSQHIRRSKEFFKDQKLHLVMIEIDDFHPIFGSPVHHPVTCIDEYIQDIPPECFHDKSYHWQLSSSAGKKGLEGTLKAHIWFWLQVPYSSAELLAWGRSIKLEADLSVFNPVQIHYTASPIFEAGVEDPVPVRSGLEVKSTPEVKLIITDEILHNVDLERKKPDALANDPIALFLHEKGYVKSYGSDGQMNITCPFHDHHSAESGETSTVYFPAHTGGYKFGAFKCMHQSCSERTQNDFLEKLNCKIYSVLNKSDQMGLASWMFDTFFKDISSATLLKRFENKWYLYIGTHFKIADDEEVRKYIWDGLQHAVCYDRKKKIKPFDCKQTDVNGTLAALQAVSQHELIEANTWTGNKALDSDYVSLKNGILDIETRQLYKHTPHFFALHSLPYDYNPNANATRWITFLHEVFDGDQESIATLQEIFGLLLTDDTSFQKVFMLIGPPRSGKGTIQRIINELLGKDNTASTSFESFAGPFGLQHLQNKLVTFFPDAKLGKRSDRSVIMERMLSISGEDSIVVNEKHKSIKSVHLKTRLFIVANDPPIFSDTTDALFKRIILLETQKSFYGRENANLTNELREELPAIFNWALKGRERLKQRGFFEQPSFSRKTLDHIRCESNPIETFVNEDCVLDSNSEIFIDKDMLFTAYRAWCSNRGYRDFANKSTFSRALLRTCPRVTVGKRTILDGRRPVFLGITLSQMVN